MIIQIVTIIIAFEMIDFLLNYIVPNKNLKGAFQNTISMIIFCAIVVMCVGIIKQSDISVFSLVKIVKTQDVKINDFEEYIQIYKQIIFNALE